MPDGQFLLHAGCRQETLKIVSWTPPFYRIYKLASNPSKVSNHTQQRIAIPTSIHCILSVPEARTPFPDRPYYYIVAHISMVALGSPPYRD